MSDYIDTLTKQKNLNKFYVSVLAVKQYSVGCISCTLEKQFSSPVDHLIYLMLVGV